MFCLPHEQRDSCAGVRVGKLLGLAGAVCAVSTGSGGRNGGRDGGVWVAM